MIDESKQALLDGLASASRKHADQCGAAARLHRAGELISNEQVAKLREELAESQSVLHDLLPENFTK